MQANAAATREVAETVADPQWFPVDLDRQRSEVIFAHTSYDGAARSDAIRDYERA